MRSEVSVRGLLNELEDRFRYLSGEVTYEIESDKEYTKMGENLYLLGVLEKQIQLVKWVLEETDDPY